jgi:riboflavin synthase
MFTGIIEELGKISRLEHRPDGARITVSADTVTEDSAEGDSISVNGVCLTALDITADSFSADVSQETLDRTTLGGLAAGSSVNLERAATPSTRLGGHIVQGHVDGRGEFISADETGDFRTVRIGFPPELARYFVYKGSVCVEGISLTIASLGETFFDIAVIPKTWTATNLSTLSPGDAVNLEADIIGKYVERILSQGAVIDNDISKETLKNAGFI